jgi:hypothetical protein
MGPGAVNTASGCGLFKVGGSIGIGNGPGPLHGLTTMLTGCESAVSPALSVALAISATEPMMGEFQTIW